MKKKSSDLTIGIDLGDRKHAVCVLDAAGNVLKHETITNNRGSLTALSRRHPGALMVMEVGMQSPWISRFLTELGHRVLVANPRKVRAIYQNVRKCDRNDAELLARLARSDESLLSPVEHGTEEMASEKYPEAEFLTQVAGVGTLTALTFILTIGDPTRFGRKRDVAAYLGLVPKRDQSGETDKQLRITKAGDSYLRRLLVGSAQYILGPFGPDTRLKRKGLELAARGGARAKRKAVVAVARKLAVLLLTLWHDEAIYHPKRHAA